MRTRLSLLALSLLAAPFAQADGYRAAPALPQYVQECSTCHIAYPLGALPNASWQRLLRTLPRHFGSDASVDPATLKAISTWVDAHPQTWKRVGEAPPEDRITRSAWFERKHREVAPATWKLAAVRSPSNCAACHPRAEEGDFDEHRVRIPR
ncbi:diheme cytochrome c [Ramlibacter alkalitolerans]|uniref:Diheme cytochrome c n=1 Tax=Ramlibacter alkalitolerans TaxID=2039631 RepID=A0ABS1JQ72_9BURK|nr:diheme cytochrome c [Ramlibacter alkalitolerans]MBL0426402.1 diheme cytochrome c [Ramlibacter alkalitolerans]